jgi:hypothetical protein
VAVSGEKMALGGDQQPHPQGRASSPWSLQLNLNAYATWGTNALKYLRFLLAIGQ